MAVIGEDGESLDDDDGDGDGDGTSDTSGPPEQSKQIRRQENTR